MNSEATCNAMDSTLLSNSSSKSDSMNSTSAVQAAVKQVLRVASYTRISDPSQRIESLCDQQRRIEDLANRMGLTVDPTLAFSDTAI